MKQACPVCECAELDEPPRDHDGKCPSYEICAACGFEFGYHDDDQGFTYESYRDDWIKRGCTWRHEGRLKAWDPFEQMAKAGIALKGKAGKKNTRRAKK